MTAIKLALSVAAFWTVIFIAVTLKTDTFYPICAGIWFVLAFGSTLLVLGLCNAAARQDHTIDT